MRLIGRIIMLVIGAFMLFCGITYIVNFTKNVGHFEWNGLANFVEALPNYLILIKGILLSLFGVSALFSFIRGKASFRYFIYSVIIIGIAVYSIIKSSSDGSFDFTKMLSTSLIIPAGYTIGSLLLFIGRRK